MDKIKWIIFAVIVVGVLGAIVWFNKSEQVTFTGDPSKVITEGAIQDRSYGSTEQKVVLIEYGDFQCPGCAAMLEPVKTLKELYQDKLTFVFRHLPLTNIHPNALASATAAEAAGQQGKFWEMHDMLYQTQSTWSNLESSQRQATFEGFATQLGLDVEKFKQDLTSKEISDKISRDRSTAKTFDANSTPTFVINGQKFDATNATNAEALTKAVEEALAKAYPDFQSLTAPATEPVTE